MSLTTQSRLLEEAFRKVGVKVARQDPLRVHQPGVGVWYAIVPPQDRAGRVLVFNKKATVQVLAASGVPAARNIETEPFLPAALNEVHQSEPLNSPIVLHPLEDVDRVPEAGERVDLTIVEAGLSWNYKAVTGHAECERVAAAAANACGLVMATVEMVHTADGPVVFEVNARSNLRKHILADPSLVDRIVGVFS